MECQGTADIQDLHSRRHLADTRWQRTFLIPKRLLKQADIEQSIRFVGMGDTIEIWKNEEEGETFMEQEEFSKALQEVMSFNNED